ncbi:MAG: metallophosphoesterase [Deltaproteobacteria bacterium]|nr:metallophosphoesterase [Deltaproteobacteria bacterium]
MPVDSPAVWSPPTGALAALAALACVLGATGCSDAADEPGEPALESLFTLAVITDSHIASVPDHVDRLTAAIDWIDEHADAQSIELVLVLGDIGWGPGLAQAKELLDTLAVPYVPLVGDNEVHAGDDESFHTTFSPQYEVLDGVVDRWRRAPLPVFDPEADMDAWLQNLAFTYRGVHFFALDLCIRGDDTIMGEFGDLHDFPGGSFTWFAEQLASLEPSLGESIVLLSHIPMFLGALDTEEMPVVDALLEPQGAFVYANLAGHLHGNLLREGSAFDVYVTDATHDDDNTIRLVEVQGNGQRFAYAHTLVVVP